MSHWNDEEQFPKKHLNLPLKIYKLHQEEPEYIL